MYVLSAALCLVSAAPALFAQQTPAANRVIGTVAAVAGNTVSIKTDSGAIVNVAVADTARVLRTPPGQKTLTGATKIAVADIEAGDRVLMVVAGDPPAATIVVVNKQSDIAAKQQQEQADWARRGVGGLVKSVDPSAGTVTITATNRTVTIHTTPATVVRRYAPDSVKFSDAQPSTLAAIQPGDQVTARGDRGADGNEVTAEEIVSGSFRNIAGTVVSIDAAAGTFTVKDLVNKKTVTIKTTPDSDLRKLDPQMAQMLAMRLKSAGSGQPAAGQAGPGNGAVLLAALAYFVLPFDFIPDMLPMLGFTDDAAVLAAAIKMVAAHITSEHREAARRARQVVRLGRALADRVPAVLPAASPASSNARPRFTLPTCIRMTR